MSRFGATNRFRPVEILNNLQVSCIGDMGEQDLHSGSILTAMPRGLV